MDEAQEAQQIVAEAERPLEERIAALPRTLAGMQLQLEVPRRLIERDEIIDGAASVEDRPQLCVRVLAGALLLCWPSVHRRQGVPRYGGDLLAYGGEAYDLLRGHGASVTDLLRAGGVAVALCVDARRRQLQAQEAARGNSAGIAAPTSASRSTSSSGSALASAALASSTPQTQDS